MGWSIEHVRVGIVVFKSSFEHFQCQNSTNMHHWIWFKLVACTPQQYLEWLSTLCCHQVKFSVKNLHLCGTTKISTPPNDFLWGEHFKQRIDNSQWIWMIKITGSENFSVRWKCGVVYSLHVGFSTSKVLGWGINFSVLFKGSFYSGEINLNDSSHYGLI